MAQGMKANHAPQATIYTATGCPQCKSGFSNRFGIFEILPISKNIATMLTLEHSSPEIEKQAIQEGFINLRQMALTAVMQGITSLEEANRVIY
jgi:type IV pilus assembly protein PilB